MSDLTKTEVIEVDAEGEIIDNHLMDSDEINEAVNEGRFIVKNGWTNRLFHPKFDHLSKKWVEGLTVEEIKNKQIEIEDQHSKPLDGEMNAIALMELTESILGGK
ncbi:MULTISPECIES: hypothetical protein [Clostridia]|uniref:hypothetical protein n=1 Tax=Clostridia TaxID=186801 RepID=UPI000EA3FCE9|nr:MULTISPECIES: hypothetical protein [Clostridia]NBJ71350.1 hypothetical protein [Roseburia sp. 1XD42-34]RKI74393.1 hypothetical protein D7V87_18760 [Clostridium sp. 1xD42-85]